MTLLFQAKRTNAVLINRRTRSLVAVLAAGLALAGLTLVAAPAQAAPVTVAVNGITFVVDTADPDAGAKAVSYNTLGGPAVEVPKSITVSGTQYAVTSIADGAFFDKGLTSVIVGNAVTHIGQDAFGSNSSLASLEIGEAVTHIGEHAFSANALTHVTIPNSVTHIGDFAFSSNSISQVTLGNSVTHIGEGAFSSNVLTHVTIPNSVTHIGSDAFSANSLNSVALGNKVTVIGAYAFFFNNLERVTIPHSVTTIGESAFGANSLESVTIGNSVTSIGANAFASNPPLSDVIFTARPPTITAAGGNGSFGPAANKTLHYPWEFHTSQITGGYTSPSWQGYNTRRGFPDVSATHQFYVDIAWVAGRGITTGYADGTFRPAPAVERQAMAAFLYRLAGSPEFTPAGQRFSDVPPDHQFYKEIEWLADEGITTGYANGTFRPKGSVERQAMAAFLFRFVDETPFTPPPSSPFSDIGPGDQFYMHVYWFHSSGVTTGFSDGTFRPKGSVQRSAMAAFLHRLNP